VERKELETGVVDVDKNDISQDPDLWNLLYASASIGAVTTTHPKGFRLATREGNDGAPHGLA
jgi:hypothetical protein